MRTRWPSFPLLVVAVLTVGVLPSRVAAAGTDLTTGLVCRDLAEDVKAGGREFKVVRDGNAAKFSFFTLPDDQSSFGITKYEVTVLHKSSDRKKNDLRMSTGTTCAQSTGRTGHADYDSYAKGARETYRCSVRSLGKGRCDFWSKNGEIKNIRDEVAVAVLRGLDARGNVRSFDVSAFATRESNVFKRSFYWGRCAWATVGLQTSRTTLLFSKASLDAIFTATSARSALADYLGDDLGSGSSMGRQLKSSGDAAGFATIFLESVMIAANLDPDTGMVRTELKLKVTESVRKAADNLVDKFVVGELNKAADELLKVQSVRAKKVKGGHDFLVVLGQSYSSARNLMVGLQDWAAVSDEIDSIC